MILERQLLANTLLKQDVDEIYVMRHIHIN